MLIVQVLRSRKNVHAEILQIRNGVDTENFRPAVGDEREAAREAFGLPQDAFVIVTCSMLYPRKNVIALVRAAARMRTRPVCVVMAGPRGPDADYLAELDGAIEELPEGVEVRLLGSLAPERLGELQRGADLYALVSRAEGLPNALLEGMATGLPCVATDIPGSADVLADGGGLLVPLDDDVRLAALFDELAADAHERSRLGREARKLVEERYSFERIAERYRALYDRLLTPPESRGPLGVESDGAR